MTLRTSDLQFYSDLDSIRNSCDVFKRGRISQGYTWLHPCLSGPDHPLLLLLPLLLVLLLLLTLILFILLLLPLLLLLFLMYWLRCCKLLVYYFCLLLNILVWHLLEMIPAGGARWRQSASSDVPECCRWESELDEEGIWVSFFRFFHIWLGKH